MVKLVDTSGLSPDAFGRASSSLATGTKVFRVVCRYGNLFQTVNLAPPAFLVRIQNNPPADFVRGVGKMNSIPREPPGVAADC